ncbi:hypothetical protein Tsubulata_016165 [Turnera subulata]|uniref:C3H1-type domain-containing protein n=1 Tax=Turnera subulata TaxID=218843 RepID=A0A9Q0GIR3_9ROSI|nr:hypothetical protein Tsubulata_016165 [Turnera subulata]
MDPSNESDEDATKKQGGHLRPKSSVDGRTGVELNSALKAGDVSGNIGSCEQSSLDTTCKQSQNIVTTTYADRDGTTLVHERLNDTRRQAGEELDLNDQYQYTQKNLVGLVGSVSGDCHTEAVVRFESLSGVSSPALPAASAGQELSVSDVETDKLWHYQDPYGKVQGPFSMMQLRKWSTSGLFPLDLRVWRITDKQDDSILLTDALVGRFHKDLSMQRSDFSELQESMVASNDVDKRLDGSSQITDGTCVGNKNADDSLKSVQNDESIHFNGDDERARSNERYSHSSSWTTLVDVAISSHVLTQSPSQGWETSKSGKSSSDQPEICGSVASPSTSGKVCETPSPPVRNDHLEEKLSSSPNNLNENSLKTIKDRSNIRETDEKRAESDSSSQSSGQNWRQPIKDSSSGWDSNSGFVSAAKSVETSDLNQGIDFSDLPSPTPNGNHEGLKEHADTNKQSAPSTVAVLDSGPTWSTASSSVVGRGQVPEIAHEWGGSMTPSRPPAEEWDSNLVSASSLKPTEGASDHTTTATPESGQLTHSPPTHPVIDASSWPLEPEFCSLADESVSDLLAEVEAMESLNGMPSPTSKMRCVEDLGQCSDNDCFSPVEGFCPTPEPGKSDALSSTGDIPMSSQLTVADDRLQLCHIPSQPVVTDGLCQMPSQLPLTDQQLMLSRMPSRPTVTAELLGASQMPSPPTTLTDEALKVSHTVTHKPRTSFSSHSCSSAEGEGDRKLSEASVNQWERGSERQPPAASTAKRETDTEFQPPIASTAGQGGSVSNVQRPALSAANASWGTMKGNTNTPLDGAAHSKTNMVWGTNHGTIQNHASANSATSAGNPGNWGNQPRYGGDRTSGPRDHRNYYQGRDSVFGRDRSWNKQPLFGGGNGGGSQRHPPKGQRVCKFYESGYCKKGASCSYWHP